MPGALSCLLTAKGIKSKLPSSAASQIKSSQQRLVLHLILQPCIFHTATGSLKPLPAVIGWKQCDTRNKMAAHHTATLRQTTLHTCGSFQWSNWPHNWNRTVLSDSRTSGRTWRGPMQAQGEHVIATCIEAAVQITGRIDFFICIIIFSVTQ